MTLQQAKEDRATKSSAERLARSLRRWDAFALFALVWLWLLLIYVRHISHFDWDFAALLLWLPTSLVLTIVAGLGLVLITVRRKGARWTVHATFTSALLVTVLQSQAALFTSSGSRDEKLCCSVGSCNF